MSPYCWSRILVLGVITLALMGCGKKLELPPASISPTPGPTFEMKTMEGKVLKSEDLKGKWTVVCIFTTWNPNSIRQAAELNDLNLSLKDQPSQLIGICLADTPEQDIREFITRNNLSFPIALASLDELPGPFRGIDVLPTTFLANPEFTLVNRYNGFVSGPSIREEIQTRIDIAEEIKKHLPDAK